MRLSTIRRLAAALRPVRWPMALSVAARTVFLLADVGLVVGVVWLVAAYAGGSADPGWGWVGALVVLAVTKALARYWEQYLGHYVAFGLLSSMRRNFFASVVPLAPAALADAQSGDLVDRVMGDVDRVEVFYAHTLAPALTALIVPVVVVVSVAVLADPILAIWLGSALLVAGIGVPFIGWRLGREKAELAAGSGGRLAGHLTDGVHGLGDVVVFDHANRRLDEMAELGRETEAAETATATVDMWRTVAFDLVAGLGLVAVTWSGLSLLAADGVDMPIVAASIAAGVMSFVPLRDLQTVIPAFERAMAAAVRIYAVADRPAVVVDPQHPVPTSDRPELVFDHVSFAYPGGDPALVDVNIRVGPGRRVGVVGSSGSGKSTLARLAVRFWDADGGAVRIGGARVEELSLAELRSKVTMLAQSTQILDGSIADNVRLANPDAADEALSAAVRSAELGDVVDDISNRNDSGVGEGGARLSGGERQRVGLARALLRDSPILILDEVTSDLDVDTEAEIMQTLNDQTGEKAVLVIAHRLHTVVDCDEIVVMDRGRVAERGTHRELLAARGLYARLWDRQMDTLA